ncbi:hypothetical protein LJY25_07425 [Hymenobacter sp. BT175]|uniref:methionyl-tRNA formyltransferase n=1 Tax=Hymenobacter translucens TaxID=2886507 RepID=UPI001D0E49C7|nr:formyltransferase family protein [Hymenobacter translucens]MCC2546271.1 hypothetical protein [Hymenobacter translucens]
MSIAVILSSSLGLPALHELVARKAVVAVAVPVTGHEEQEQLATQATAAGWPVVRLTRPGLAAELLTWLADCRPRAVLVFTLPWRIPARVLALGPELGFLNVHFAALPTYRGPEPLFWQIRNGETAGAVTIHRMEADFDTGPVLLTEPVAIGPHETHGLHRSRLALAAAGLMPRLTAAVLGQQTLEVQAQDPTTAKYWPRPSLADVCVRWEEPADSLYRLVRATNPWNRGALATVRGQVLRLLACTPLPGAGHVPPGTLVHASAENGVLVACGHTDLLRLDVVALEEGYFSGSQLATLGLQPGEVLGNPLSIPVPLPAMATPV